MGYWLVLDNHELNFYDAISAFCCRIRILVLMLSVTDDPNKQ